jgi:hypothetical protein
MTGVNQQQLDGIGARFDKGFDEIKNLMRSFDERIRSVELRAARCSPLLVARITAAEKKLLVQQEEISDLREMMQLQAGAAEKISNAVKVISGWGKWAAGIATILISSGLLFFIGRLIYLSITGNAP